MAAYHEFAEVNGTLRQYAASATASALRHARNGLNTRHTIDGRGAAHDSWEQAWVMVEDVLQEPVGFGGVVYWEPDVEEPSSGQVMTLVVQGYDLARRTGVRVTVPMVSGRKNPLHRTATGRETVIDIPVPAVAEPRYASWDLSSFADWAEWHLVLGARQAKQLAKYRAASYGPTRQYPEQRYAEAAEYSGFAFVDGARRTRGQAHRTGAYWLGKPKSIAWKPGEAGARDQARALLLDKAKAEEFALTAVWWTEDGVTQARVADVVGGRALASTWRIARDRSFNGFLLRAAGVPENLVVQTEGRDPVRYTL